MANEAKTAFLKELTERYGSLRKLERSQSLYEIGMVPPESIFAIPEYIAGTEHSMV